MNLGMCSARGVDAHRLKTQTGLYASLDPNDPEQRILLNDGNSKADRGFNHPKLGRYLLPVKYLEEYDKDSTRYAVYIFCRSLTQPSAASVTKSTAVYMPLLRVSSPPSSMRKGLTIGGTS